VHYIKFAFLIAVMVVCTGCDVDVSENPPAPDFVTATLPPTSIPQPTQTPPPPTPVPTIPPIEGTTTTQVNVRAESSTASENLGLIAQFSKVQIIGKDASGSWYQIIYADSAKGVGWVRAEYVEVAAGVEIPVIGTEAGGGSGVSGLVVQKINVRSGPGTSHEALGVLNPNDVVFITGKDPSGAWMQIEFASSPDGTAWAASEFLRVEDPDTLPVIRDVEEDAETMTVEASIPGSLLIPAMQDGDSAQSPLTKVSFSPTSIRTLQIEGDVSAPDGDTEDWIEFSSFGSSVVIQVSCSNNGLQVELWNPASIQDEFLVPCGGERNLHISARVDYKIRLSGPPSNEFRYTRYILKIKANP
jgi:uncharacterized protein YraI